MKQSEIKNCHCCGKGVGHTGHPMFFKIELTRMILDAGAIQRQAGLEMRIGGPLALVMGPNEDIAKELPVEKRLLCMDCMLQGHLAQLMED